jgi:DNA-directed RNA polymerase subunit F
VPESWIAVLVAAIGVRKSTDETQTVEAAVANFKKLLEMAFAEMNREEGQRLGTRVEAVSYIDEFTMMEQESIARYVEKLSSVTSARQKERNELIACIPMTCVPPEMSDDKAEIRRKTGTNSITEYQANPAVNPRLLMLEESPDTTFITLHRAVSPPVVTEPMELNEWTISLLASLRRIKPSDNLKSLLDQAQAQAVNGEQGSSQRWVATIIPLLNRFLSRMQLAVTGGAPEPLPITVNEEGEAVTVRRTQDTQLWGAILQLYYHSLESILVAEERGNNAKVVLSTSFHEALLGCAYLCVARAVTITGKINLTRPENHQIYTILPITGSTPYTYLKVTESFLRALSSDTSDDDKTSKQLVDSFGSLPRILQKEIKNSEGYVIESLLWVRDNKRTLAEGCIVNTIAELKQTGWWPPDSLKPTAEEGNGNAIAAEEHEQTPKHPEVVFVSYLSRKLQKVAHHRVLAICKSLSIPTDYPVATQVWFAFRYLLRTQVELLYGRHIDQWILCTIYGICRAMKYEPAITFTRLIDVYVSVRAKDLGSSTCQAIVRHVKILDAAGDENGDPMCGSTKMGNIIRLYNLVFVPIMKSYLLQSEALRKNTVILFEKIKDSHGESKESNAPAPATVTEGNVTLQLSLSGNNAGTGTAAILGDPLTPDHQGGDSAGASSEYKAFLELGRGAQPKVSSGLCRSSTHNNVAIIALNSLVPELRRP